MEQMTDQQFEKEVKDSGVPILVDFYADWCGPCKSLTPKLEKMSPEFDGKIKFAKMNVDENPSTPSKFGIRGVPTLMLFKGGNLVSTLVGDQPVDRLKAFLNSAL